MLFYVNKINQLARIPWSRRMGMLLFQLCKTIRLPFSKNGYTLNAFLTTHLLRFDGRLRAEGKGFYTTDFFFSTKVRSRITLRKKPSSDFAVFDQVFILKEYQPVLDLMLETTPLSAPLKIMDAGANIGLTSLFFSRFFTNASYCLVEPDEGNFMVLKQNIGQNNLPSTLIKGGLWSHDTSLTIKRDFRDGNDWSVSVAEVSYDTTLKGYSFETLASKAGFGTVDLLKIDIEGSEKELFRDPVQVKSMLSKTKFICIEIHDEFHCRQDIYNQLLLNDFLFFEKDGLTIGYNKQLVKAAANVLVGCGELN